MMVHLVTDRRRLAPGASWAEARRCLLEQVESAIAGGVNAIQVREPDLEARSLAGLVAEMVERAKGSETRVLVNERIDVALVSGAHGVHLPAASIPPFRARTLVPPGFLIGCSVHSTQEAQRAAGADYLVAGTVWPSASKPVDHRTLGPEGLMAIVRTSRCPVLAIGGVTGERAAEASRAGAAGIAAIGLFIAQNGAGLPCRAAPLDQVLRTLRASFDRPGSRS